MRLSHLLNAEKKVFADLFTECEEFLACGSLRPLQRTLPNSYSEILHRIKVRKRKGQSDFNNTFNEAFTEETHELRQRAVFVNGTITENEDLFYILPPNGFKFIYSTEVTNSTEQYRSVFESILSSLDDQADITFQDLLKFTYKSENLDEGITSGAEIILYNIPYYYAIKQSTYPDYQELLSLIRGE